MTDNAISLNELQDDVIRAYKQIKSHVYYDNTNLHLRAKIAAFEAAENFEEKLSNLAKKLYEFSVSDNYDSFSDIFDKISYFIIPKSYESREKETLSYEYINKDLDRTHRPKKLTYFIKCKVEVHIISTLWVSKIGKILDTKVDESVCFANRLATDEDERFKEWGLKVFEPYFIAYRNWRDKALEVSKKLHQSEVNSAVLSLDVKNYYDSVNIDLSSESFSKLNKKYNFLNLLLARVHDIYKNARKKENNLLPIGLMSSAVLSNYALSDFDRKFNEEFKPAYYGRYVDDILVVIASPVSKADLNDTPLVKELLKGKKSILLENEDTTIKLNSKNGEFHAQPEKTKAFLFFADGPISLIEQFESKIATSSSEFRLLLEDSNILEKFSTDSFKIDYTDSVNKLRSVENFGTDKWGASDHLAKLAEASKAINKIDDKNSTNLEKQIIQFFDGISALEHYSLWEKVFTFYVLNNKPKELKRFARHIISKIMTISYTFDEDVEFNVIKSLLDLLGYCFSMSAGLNMKFFKEQIFEELKKYSVNIDSDNKQFENALYTVITKNRVDRYANFLTKANLLRHQYCAFPLVNYCEQTVENLMAFEAIKNGKLNIDTKKIKYSPRFIHYHEIAQFYFLKDIFQVAEKKNGSVQKKKLGKEDTLAKIRNDFRKFNNLTTPDSIKKDSLPYSSDNLSLTHININDKSNKDKLRIAIANVQIDEANSIENLVGSPNLSLNRFIDMNHILNLAMQEKADLVVFPEMYLPVQWIDNICKFVKRNKIGVICGLEHIQNSNKEALNYSATVLPFKGANFDNVFLDLRLKANYSYDEIDHIQNLKLKVPKGPKESVLYSWKNTYFSTFNCFELANIQRRSKLLGHVDFVVAIENNRDVEYFGQLVSSMTRDIHAYVIQVNNSKYGDSRISQPAQTYQKDLLRIKGGLNSTIIIGEIDIDALRLFQFGGETGKVLRRSKGSVDFKPKPPGFEPSKLRRPTKIKKI